QRSIARSPLLVVAPVA
ncbi:2Fe-2S iron-sulfur cluster binding domain protein, partial [Vibrio parahaemolyticus V-223/04]